MINYKNVSDSMVNANLNLTIEIFFSFIDSSLRLKRLFNFNE